MTHDIFGIERTKESIAGIIGNVMQSFDGEELYPSIEGKAAHLLYFIIKILPRLNISASREGVYTISIEDMVRNAKALIKLFFSMIARKLPL